MLAMMKVFPLSTAEDALQRVFHHFWRYSWTEPVFWIKRHGDTQDIDVLKPWYYLSRVWRKASQSSSPTALADHAVNQVLAAPVKDMNAVLIQKLTGIQETRKWAVDAVIHSYTYSLLYQMNFSRFRAAIRAVKPSPHMGWALMLRLLQTSRRTSRFPTQTYPSGIALLGIKLRVGGTSNGGIFFILWWLFQIIKHGLAYR